MSRNLRRVWESRESVKERHLRCMSWGLQADAQSKQFGGTALMKRSKLRFSAGIEMAYSIETNVWNVS